jgi:hypothetical protein
MTSFFTFPRRVSTSVSKDHNWTNQPPLGRQNFLDALLEVDVLYCQLEEPKYKANG